MRNSLLFSVIFFFSAFSFGCSSNDEPIQVSVHDDDEYSSVPYVDMEDCIVTKIPIDSLDNEFLRYIIRIRKSKKNGSIPSIEDENRKWNFEEALLFEEEDGQKSAQIVPAKDNPNVAICSFKTEKEGDSRIFILESVGDQNYRLYNADNEIILGMIYDTDNSALICTFILDHAMYKVLCSMASYMAGQWLMQLALPITDGFSDVVGLSWAIVSGLCC